MPVVLLTKKVTDGLSFEREGQALYRDSALKGFGVRVGKSSKVWFAEGQVKGRTRRVTIGRADVMALEIARKKAMAILCDMAGGIDANHAKRVQRAERITLDSAFEAFFAAKPNLSPHTHSAYRRTQQKYLSLWKAKSLQDITRQMVLAQHRNISDTSGNATANSVFRHFRSVYNFAAAGFDVFPPNPVVILTQARAWHRERRRRTVIAAQQLPAWWQAVHDETRDARDILLLALFTGMRRSEVLALKWDHIDMANRSLHMPTSKNGDPLDLPMSEVVADIVRSRREVVGQTEWVFPGDGSTGHILEVKSVVRRVVEASGVRFSMHDLRRTFITIAESLDVPAYALKRLLNHRADSDVTGGYIVINAERLRGPAELVAKRILELVDA